MLGLLDVGQLDRTPVVYLVVDGLEADGPLARGALVLFTLEKVATVRATLERHINDIGTEP